MSNYSGVIDQFRDGDIPDSQMSTIYKVVLADNAVLEPGMATLVKVQLKGASKPNQVCTVEGSEKIKGIIGAVSANDGSTGDTWVQLQDPFRRRY